VVVITSPSVGDGKTTMALHLSTMLATALGKRVVTIDAALHRPRLGHAAGIPEGVRGLREVLRGDARFEDCLWRLGRGELLVCPAGGSGTSGASPLAGALGSLRARWDYVVIDAPAASGSADAALLARFADGVVLVVRAGVTRRDALDRALDALIDAPITGCVLNDHDGPVGNWAARPRFVAAGRREVRALGTGRTEAEED
jgi:Mrp family chromosome partitioning ATPase